MGRHKGGPDGLAGGGRGRGSPGEAIGPLTLPVNLAGAAGLGAAPLTCRDAASKPLLHAPQIRRAPLSRLRLRGRLGALEQRRKARPEGDGDKHGAEHPKPELGNGDGSNDRCDKAPRHASGA